MTFALFLYQLSGLIWQAKIQNHGISRKLFACGVHVSGDALLKSRCGVPKVHAAST